MATRGVDFADMDGNKIPDLETAKAAGLQFAIVRACEGTVEDTMFRTYWKLLKDQGVKRGAYCLLRFGAGAPTPEAQVDKLLSLAGMPLRTDLPATIDLEFPGGRKAYSISPTEALAWFLRALRQYKAATGVQCQWYSSYVVWQDPDGMNGLPCPELADYVCWPKYYPFPVHTVAHIDPAVVDALPPPPCPPPADGTWGIEQYQGDAIKWPGFPGLTDCDRFNVISHGSTGGFVKWVQRRVKVPVDGVYGPVTAGAVAGFQRTHGLEADGVVGPDTYGYLNHVIL